MAENEELEEHESEEVEESEESSDDAWERMGSLISGILDEKLEGLKKEWRRDGKSSKSSSTPKEETPARSEKPRNTGILGKFF